MARDATPHRLLDVITPSLSAHAHHYAQQLDSWVRFCADVGSAVAFYVVVSKKDRRAFEVTADRFAKIAQVSVLLIENLVNATLQPPELRGILREHILLSNNPGTMTARRHSYQSAKKMLGCLGAAQSDAHPSGDRGATWCLLTDSETRLIRPTSAAAMLDAYQRRRTILYNGNWQPKGYWRCVTQNDQALLPNLPVNQSSWFLEAYAWFVERHVVAEFVRTAFPHTADGLRQEYAVRRGHPLRVHCTDASPPRSLHAGRDLELLWHPWTRGARAKEYELCRLLDGRVHRWHADEHERRAAGRDRKPLARQWPADVYAARQQL